MNSEYQTPQSRPSAMHAASQWPGKEPTNVDDAPASAC